MTWEQEFERRIRERLGDGEVTGAQLKQTCVAVADEMSEEWSAQAVLHDADQNIIQIVFQYRPPFGVMTYP